MHNVDSVVALVLAAAVLAGLAHALGVHYAIVLVLGGLALGFVPGIPTPRVQPNLVLFVFLPPLVYAAAFGSSTRDLRRYARPITVLAIGLVLATMCVVAAIVHVVSGFGWGPSMVLGAILGATDPVAATSVLRRLGAPERVATILEGEALINDGTGLTAYAIAVAAVLNGHFSLLSGVLQFLAVAAGGIAIGLAAGWISTQIRRRLDEPSIELSISLLTAYLAYIPAERLGASGVLAAVAAGLYVSRQSSSVFSATTRLRILGFWEALTFLLESVLFLLIGLQLERILGELRGGAGRPLLYSAAVLGGLVGIRFIWMFVVPGLVRVAGEQPEEARRASVAERLVLGWSGMRGGVSLAAALAIPLSARGHAFSDRSTLVFVSYIAIATTIVVPGLTLGPLVRWLGVGEAEVAARAERRARAQMARAALERLEEIGRAEPVSAHLLDALRMNYELRIQRLEPDSPPEEARNGGGERQIRGLRRELIGVERRELAQLRRQGKLSIHSQRRLEHDLDLEESRLGE